MTNNRNRTGGHEAAGRWSSTSGSYAAKLEGFYTAAILACISGKRYKHGGFTWRLASGNPPAPWCCVVRYQWQ